MDHSIQPKIVLLEETRHWSEDIQRRAGRIFAAYLFDAGQTTNCCELTPSYDLTYLYSTSTCGIDDEDLQATLLRDGAGEGFKYVHCRAIDAMPASHVYVSNGLPWVSAGDDESYDELFEKCREYFVANVKIDIPPGTLGTTLADVRAGIAADAHPPRDAVAPPGAAQPSAGGTARPRP